MKKAERIAHIERRAHELAATARFENWLSIETTLRLKEGFSDARFVLDRRDFRDLLDRECKAARAYRS